MKFDVNHVLVDLAQAPLKQGEKDFTLGDAATAALLSDYQDERLSGQEKSRRYSLAVKIHGANGKPLDLDLDDAKLIRDLVAKAYAPIVAGQVWQLLNGDGVEESP